MCTIFEMIIQSIKSEVLNYFYIWNLNNLYHKGMTYRCLDCSLDFIYKSQSKSFLIMKSVLKVWNEIFFGKTQNCKIATPFILSKSSWYNFFFFARIKIHLLDKIRNLYIYLSLHTSRMQHKVNFKQRFEFRVFLLLERLPYQG